MQTIGANFRFSAAVAGFGMLLRDSEFVANLSWESRTDLAIGARGQDPCGDRDEFIRKIKTCRLLEK